MEYATPVARTEENPNAGFVVPVIENIHIKILEAVDKPGALDMLGGWHICETTHCRFGWAVFLAGEAGIILEEKTSTIFAALQIYHASCPEVPVSPVRAYESNEIAMADMRRCATEQEALNKSIL